jgi:hypothetical protein
MIVQPVQLSLLPDQVPAPPPAVTGQQVDAAVTLLAGLIAKAAGTAATGAGAGDE